jgi:hypothetical protein
MKIKGCLIKLGAKIDGQHALCVICGGNYERRETLSIYITYTTFRARCCGTQKERGGVTRHITQHARTVSAFCFPK